MKPERMREIEALPLGTCSESRARDEIIRELLDELRWRPIESAETLLLGAKIMVGAWLEDQWVQTLVFRFHDGWMMENRVMLPWSPTHWRPLPPPPEDAR